MKNPLKAILFDFDHTLADPSQGTEDCINFALDRLGLPPAPAEAIQRTVGLTLKEGFGHLAAPEHGEHCEAFIRLFVQRADETMIGLTALFDTVPAVVKQLKAQGLALGIVSLKYREHLLPVLERGKVTEAFEIIIGGREVSKPKPDPEGVHLAMTRLGSSPANTLYVGDSLTDAETAKRAGLPFVAVLSGTTSREAFEAYEVYHVLEHLAQLPKRLLENDER
jgi:phosphoglycolate phosphatase